MNGHALKNWHYCEGKRKAGKGQDCPLKHRIRLGGIIKPEGVQR